MPGYELTLHAYCGMSVPEVTADECLDRDEARQSAAKLLRRRRRQGFPVTTHKRGLEWEIMEPENALMVPDQCGTLVLVAPPEIETDDDFEDVELD